MDKIRIACFHWVSFIKEIGNSFLMFLTRACKVGKILCSGRQSLTIFLFLIPESFFLISIYPVLNEEKTHPEMCKEVNSGCGKNYLERPTKKLVASRQTNVVVNICFRE